MEDPLQIENFIESYPALDENIGYEVFRRKEFLDYKLDLVELISGEPGNPLLSQQISKTFFSPHTPYDRCLFFHEPGTGKTCLSSFIVENFKNVMVNGKPRNPALILSPNEILMKNFEGDVIKRCTDDVYKWEYTEEEAQRVINMGEAIQLTKQTEETRLKKAVHKTYEMVTHETFIPGLIENGVLNKKSIEAKYSNRIIVIDEAHRFRMQTESGKGKKKKKTVTNFLRGEEAGLSLENYTYLKEFLHTVKNCRIILLTATPIPDSVDEIASLMNLILDPSDQLPTGKMFIKEYFKDGILTPEGEENLRKKFNGKVSFLRSISATAKKIEMGEVIPPLKKIKVYPSVMSEFQTKIYEKAENEVVISESISTNKEGETFDRRREKKGGSMDRLPKDASIFVFPKFNEKGELVDGLYEKKGYIENIQMVMHKRALGKKQNINVVYSYKNKLVESYIRNHLAELSSKFYHIIQEIRKHPDELVFIYNESVQGCGGVINLALVLQAHGFIWAKSSKGIQTKNSQKRFCVMTHKEGTIQNPNEIKKFLDSFNQPDNRYGDRCQIIIGSKKISEGLTIKNVRQGYIMSPHWNSSTLIQALGRIFRVGSHDAFEREEEKYIRIYKLAALKHGNDMKLGDVSFSLSETYDLKVYSRAEKKDLQNAQIYRILKEVSWDCALNYKRNVLPQMEDYSYQADYAKKNYRCHNFPEEYIDTSTDVWNYSIPEDKIIRNTYDLFYSKNEMQQIIKGIQDLFQKKSYYYLDEFYPSLHLHPRQEFLLLQTLDFIINSRMKIKNRYGVGYFLNEDVNYYYLDDSTEFIGEKYNSFYAAVPYIYEITTAETLSNVYQYTSDERNMKILCDEPTEANVKKLNHRTSIIILEYICELSYSSNSKTSKQKKVIDVVMRVLGHNLHTVNENKLIHAMYYMEYLGLGYNVSLKEIVPSGKMRIFDGVKWEYVTDLEKEGEYIKLFKSTEKKKGEDEWDVYDKGIYGFVDKKDKKFKIKIKPAPGEKPTRGFVCVESRLSKLKIYKILHDLNILPEPFPDYLKMDRPKLLQSIKALVPLNVFFEGLPNRSDKELRSILTLYSMDKKQICAFVEDAFKKNGMFKTI